MPEVKSGEPLELTEVTLKRLQYKQMNDMKRRELEKTIYKNADWIDKIKIRLRRFFTKPEN
jgi:hypothetical protein